MKRLLIPSCRECPHCGEEFYSGDYCYAGDVRIPIDDVDTIPDWCPLPDAPESREKGPSDDQSRA